MPGYEQVKRAQIIHSLPPEEQQELEDLEALKHRSLGQEVRRSQLWEQAFDAHVPPQVDPLFAYAAEVGAHMRAKKDGAS